MVVEGGKGKGVVATYRFEEVRQDPDSGGHEDAGEWGADVGVVVWQEASVTRGGVRDPSDQMMHVMHCLSVMLQIAAGPTCSDIMLLGGHHDLLSATIS